MKKSILRATVSILSCLVCTFAITAVSAFENRDDEKTVSLVINEEWVVCEQPPLIVNDRTIVPVRVISEKMGCQVKWYESDRKVTVTKDDTVMELYIDKKMFILNGIEKELDVAPTIWYETTMVPVRVIAETLECDVQWNGNSYVVLIDSPIAVERYNNLSTEIKTYDDSEKVTLNGYIVKELGYWVGTTEPNGMEFYYLVTDTKANYITFAPPTVEEGRWTYTNIKRLGIECENADPDDFIGKHVKVTGEIMGPPATGSTADVRIYATSVELD